VSSSALARTPAPALLTDADKALIKDTWRLVEPLGETTADLFYRRLFELEPSYRALFKTDLTAQKRKLLAMLAFIVKSLSWVDASWREEVDPESDLFLIVLALGRRHRELYGIPDEAYATVRDTLLWTLDYGLGEAFTPEAQSAWRRVYDLVATTMKLGRGATELGKSIEPSEGGRP
jgi:hemoglobin-like flavoprotein